MNSSASLHTKLDCELSWIPCFWNTPRDRMVKRIYFHKVLHVCRFSESNYPKRSINHTRWWWVSKKIEGHIQLRRELGKIFSIKELGWKLTRSPWWRDELEYSKPSVACRWPLYFSTPIEFDWVTVS